MRPTRALSALSLSARYRSPFFLARSKRLALLSASEAIASNSLTMSFRGMLRSTNERILASRSIIYSLRLMQVRYEQAVGHALLKVPDHRRLACRDRDCQRPAPSRSELDHTGPIARRAEDHDPVVASHYRRLVLCYSSSASRFTAGASEFFFSRNLWHDQPVRHARLEMLEDAALSSRHADRRRLAACHPKLDDVGPVALGAVDHDAVLAGRRSHAHRQRSFPQSSSASRFTAGASAFFILSQSGER